MKVCEYCEQLIEGEALIITPVSDSGAAPDVFWHRERAACGRPRPPRADDTRMQPGVRRI